MIVVTVVICTRDRAEPLRQTLDALAATRVPTDLPTELLVVDNGSRDETPLVVRAARLPNMVIRYIREERRGKSVALNTAIAAARGEIILITDDDIRPTEQWVEAMCRPIRDGTTIAVAGRVRIPPHLDRPWIAPRLRICFAGPRLQDLDRFMAGANMAVARTVFSRVPGFDAELGPGGLGFGEESLFCQQLREAGYRWMVGGEETTVEHHFDEDRLRLSAFVDSARRRGRSQAYRAHHWLHEDVHAPRLRLLKAYLDLLVARARRGPRAQRTEGISVAEFNAWKRVGFFRQFLTERRRPRNYALRGLVKAAGPGVRPPAEGQGAGPTPGVSDGAPRSRDGRDVSPLRRSAHV
jgi:glucosyl-dolichyl phosphate glucuronosyltransferase